jgi:hypothetical protein
MEIKRILLHIRFHFAPLPYPRNVERVSAESRGVIQLPLTSSIQQDV